MKLYLSILLLIVFPLLAHAGQKVEIKVDYSRSADIFEVMDNVANWWPGFNEEEYFKYWEKEFGISEKDKELFSRYSKIREKYYDDPDQKEKNPLLNRNGFFSTNGSSTADPFAEAFYSSNSLDEALLKLSKLLSTEEFVFAKEFYDHFKPKYEKLIEKDGADFSSSIKLVRDTFAKKGVGRFFDQVAKFYDVKGVIKYRVLFTWWPPLNRSNASPTGGYLIMRYSPTKHSGRNESDVVSHEIVHTISAKQTLEQKKSLTELFLKKCAVQDHLKKLTILEEPLAVVFGQLLFSEQFQRERFSLADNLYNNPWINSFSRALFVPIKMRFEKGETIRQGTIDDAATICGDLQKAASMLTSAAK